MQLLKEKYEMIVFYAAAVCIFVFSLMFQAINLNVILGFGVVFFIYSLIKYKGIADDRALRLISLAGLLVAVIDFHRGTFTYHPFFFLFIWPCFYMLGKMMLGSKDNIERNTVIAIAVPTVGLFIQGILNYANHNEDLLLDLDGKGWNAWNEFWTGTWSSRTVYVFDFILVAGCLFLAFALWKKNKVYSIIIALLNIVAFVIDFVFAHGRLCICVQVLTLFFVGVIYLIKERASVSEKTKRIIKIAFIVIFAVAILAIILVTLNVAGLHDVYKNSFLNRDGGILGNVRFASMKEGLILMLQQPVGGWKTPSLGIAHNVFMLFSQEYDTIVFITMIAYELVIVFRVVKLLLTKCSLVDYTIVSILVAVNLYYMIETCPWRYRNYWFFLLYFGGMLSRKLELKNEAK